MGLRASWAPLSGVLLGVALLGCAAMRLDYTPAGMRQEVARRAPQLDVADIVVPYEVDQEAITKARRLLRGRYKSPVRVQALIDLLSDPEGFGLRYQWAATASAAETLERGHGNCFSLSSVLIGLARGVGMSAYYVEVLMDDPLWRFDGTVALKVDHIAAVIVTGAGRQIVDFTGEIERARRIRVLDDLEALAHFYNNRGYEILHAAERRGEPIPWDRALLDFELATQIHPTLARAWNNLGVARSRLGDSAGAEAAYYAALELEERTQSAHLNLAVLYLREGRREAAREHLRAAQRLDPRNPRIEGLFDAVEDAGSEAALDG